MQKLWGRKISDLAFASFIEKLEHVAKKYNTIVQKVGRYYPSSKTCSCGVINQELSLKDRTWTCSSCNTTHRRDFLAACNILSEGIRIHNTKCQTSAVELLVFDGERIPRL